MKAARKVEYTEAMAYICMNVGLKCSYVRSVKIAQQVSLLRSIWKSLCGYAQLSSESEAFSLRQSRRVARNRAEVSVCDRSPGGFAFMIEARDSLDYSAYFVKLQKACR